MIVLAVGLAGCAFFALAVWSRGATRLRAEGMARVMVASIERQRQELERSIQELQQFACIASHDLRAPLRGIKFLVSSIEEDHAGDLPDPVKERLADVGACARRMDDLLNSILDYSRLKDTKIQRQLIETAGLVAEAVKIVSPPAGFEVSIEGDLPNFHGVPARILQVFANLVANAVKHHDRREGRIVITGREDGGECEFRVRDDGPGVPEQFRERVFEPFKTLRPRDEVEGSGMGLAIVKRTVEGHGGRVWIEDDGKGRGACVAFTVKRGSANT